MIINPESTVQDVHNSKSNRSYSERVLNDYYLACLSREASIIGRKEVLTGKAKFGILGDGKEIPQVALSHFFKKGDFRAGYYRDQTLMMALGICDIKSFFAQLYADPTNDPYSGGRQMNNHFATPLKDANDQWISHLDKYNVSADISSTGGQMARALGLAMASKKYRDLNVDKDGLFSDDGNEIVFCTIGDASTSEGIFWETLNAASVTQVPLVVLVWDDGYGISVPIELQTTKGSISKASEGFLLDENGDGIHIYTAKAWDYAELINVYDKVTTKVRAEHRPALIHIQECTQPQGHSTSGSHERYKSKDRLEWEKDFDGIGKMKEWIIANNLVSETALEEVETKAKTEAKEGSKAAWAQFQTQLSEIRSRLSSLFRNLPDSPLIAKALKELDAKLPMGYGEITALARRLANQLRMDGQKTSEGLREILSEMKAYGHEHYDTHLYSEADSSALNIPVVPPTYSDDSESVTGYQVINRFFDLAFEAYPNALAFGEDVGHIGDVNQGFAGLQDKYGVDRIFDTGIREWSIMGQAIGMAMRGLRPIAEIQYLDYLIYGLAPLSDDLATLRYRSDNLQTAPAIIRTRGHRLEGIWHAGSPLGMMLNSLKGIYLCVPRNFVQAAGMYATLLKSTDPGIVIEVLNGYRLKETMPDNIGEYTVPLGVPELITEGTDLTIVTYGPNVRYAQEAVSRVAAYASIELIDVQTLIPFDLEHRIVESLKKTSKILFLDEDVPGSSSAYMMQQVLEVQGGYQYLDGKPRTLSAKEHRCAFGSDGDYFSKPQVEDIVAIILEMIAE